MVIRTTLYPEIPSLVSVVLNRPNNHRIENSTALKAPVPGMLAPRVACLICSDHPLLENGSVRQLV